MPSTAQGVQGAMAVACTAFPNRIDFNLSPDTTPGGVPELKLIDDGVAFFAELDRIARFLADGEKVGIQQGLERVALFVQFAKLVPHVVEANREISKVIPERYRVSLSAEEAFALQISEPILTRSAPTIRVNFLRKWSVEQFQVVSFGMGPAGGVGAAGPQGIVRPIVANFLGACVAFDINTVPPHEQLTREKQSEILIESLQLARETLRSFGLDVKVSSDDSTRH
jgi:hypothetical protein